VRRRRERLHTDGAEINLIPMLDMVSLLVQVLLMNVQFNAYAQVGARPITASADATPPAAALDLQIGVSPDGFVASWSEAGARQERRFAAEDAASLERLAAELSDAHPDEETAIVVPGGAIPFEVVVGTMDALREHFTDVALGDAN
jgi:biopolymer transport protein ExbD